MRGKLLIGSLRRRLSRTRRPLTQNQLARVLGVTQANVSTCENTVSLTPRQVANLIKASITNTRRAQRRQHRKEQRQAVREAITPVIEFFKLKPIEQRARVELFQSREMNRGHHPYLQGLKERLKQCKGIYIFYDSRGRALYAGKTVRNTLWSEMKSAFNRDRGEVQRIKRVNHPARRQQFHRNTDGTRRIRPRIVPLYELATYVSAYEVAPELIGKLEALLVRGFANDLLNIRMERFAKRRHRHHRRG